MRKCVSGEDLGLATQKRRSCSTRLKVEEITDADYADDIALITDTATDQARTFLHSLEKVFTSTIAKPNIYGHQLQRGRNYKMTKHGNTIDIATWERTEKYIQKYIAKLSQG